MLIKKKYILYPSIIVVISFIYILFMYGSTEASVFWSSILINTFYFLSLSAFGYLFLSIHIMAGSTWYIPIKFLLLSMGRSMPIFALMLIISLLGIQDIYKWAQDPSVAVGKSWYLNSAFFMFRTIFSVTVWLVLIYFLKKYIEGSRAKILFPTLFVLFFFISFLIISHDWLLTICCIWNSTLFSWYIFIGLLSIGMAGTIVLFLVNTNAKNLIDKKKLLIDCGRYLFTFSCVWMYFWFSQFMLIWYGNIEHETFYYARQFFDFKWLFISVLVLNFGIPLVLLISKLQKKQPVLLLISSLSILLGQWLNLYLTIFPNAIHTNKVYFVPFAFLMLYGGIFLLISFNKGRINFKKRLILIPFLLGTLFSCQKGKNHPGYNYYPEMTYSRPYQTLSSNPNFEDNATMRNPVEGTVPREMLPFQYVKSSEERLRAGEELQNPIKLNQQSITDGKFLYESFCEHCHGISGDGLGKLFTDKLYTYKPGVLTSEKIINAKDGDIYHAISVGYNLMGSHKSILLPDERWKIVNYIRALTLAPTE